MAASRNGNGSLGSVDVARRAVEQIAVLTGRPVEGVLGLRRADDGWEVTLELLELRRVPDSTDVLASYEVSLDKGGDLQEYRRGAPSPRTRGGARYSPNHVEEV